MIYRHHLNAGSSLPYNRIMKHTDILLPFALPHSELAADLLKAINAPSLAMLLGRANAAPIAVFDAFSRSLPHENWLAEQVGAADFVNKNSSLPMASAAMRHFRLQPDDGVWFMLHPVHFHIARDHLVLTDIRQLAISDAESRALFDAAQPLFAETGKQLVYGDRSTWFVQAPDWEALQTASPDAACGHNIDIWMPKGPQERGWRKLQNEVQMHWHMHPVNAEREMRGLKPVNSIWLWGGASNTVSMTSGTYAEAFLSGWSAYLESLFPSRHESFTATEVIDTTSQCGLVTLDALTSPALANDWSEWLVQFNALETNWFAPLLEALKSGKIEQIRLIFTHNTALSKFTVTRNSLRKFWVKPSLARLIP
jgi:hypothetical protein